MKESMKLTKKRERLFNEHYQRIVSEARNCYQEKIDFDDILQIILMNYVKALKNADLRKNFHAYCMKYAQWACYKEFKARKSTLQHHACLEDLNVVLDYDYSLNNVFYNNSTENEASLNSFLSKIIELHNNLKPHERSVVNSFLLGENKKVHNIKIRRQQMIAKAFKEGVRELLIAA